MVEPRLTWIRVEGFRSAENVTLELDGLRVLIGENGSGKSTLIESCELLARSASDQRFTNAITSQHGSIQDLLRFGRKELRISVGATVPATNGGELPVEYSLELSAANLHYPTISGEVLRVGGALLIDRTAGSLQIAQPNGPLNFLPFTVKPAQANPESTALSSFWGNYAPEGAHELKSLLSRIQVHVPFDTRASWTRPPGREPPSGPRGASPIEPAPRLERGATNLASAYMELRNQGGETWREVMIDVRAGLGSDIDEVSIPVQQRGFAELGLTYSGLGMVRSSQLSDGQLSYLALVALRHLNQSASLVLFDEPELHLHPSLLVHSTWLFKKLAERQPVVLATHSDAVLDTLADDPDSIRVVSLDSERRTQVRRLDREALKKWSSEYASVAELRREGLLDQVTEATQ